MPRPSRSFRVALLAGFCWSAAGPAAWAAPRATPPLARLQRLEVVQMFAAILKGAPMGPGAGWFHPAQSRYGWKWLAGRFDADRDGSIRREEFTGPPEFFERLDRNRDGRLTAEDLDWSPQSQQARQTAQAEALFRRAAAAQAGRLSADEWRALFRRAAGGKDHLPPDDLRALLFPPPPGHPEEMPGRLTLLLGL